MEQEFTLWDNDKKEKVEVVAKKSGKSWKALCPFHDDQKHPNLNIDEDKRVYHCFACNKSGALYDPKYKKGSTKTYKKKTITKAKIYKDDGIERTYDYKDRRGELVYQVVRGKDKKFSQRRPDGAGDWIWNLEGIKKVPYNLPDIIAPSDQLILIVEGEKDCDNLKKENILATTNSEGTGKWHSEHNNYFKDRNVVLIPDNDDVGYKHMQEVGRNLKGIAKSIRWLTLPGLKKGGDVSNWLEKGGDVKNLFKLIGIADEFEPDPNIVLEEETKKNKKTEKEKTRTLIPGLIHLVKEGEQVGYLLQNSGNFYVDESFTGKDGITYKPKRDLPIYYCGADILKESRKVNYSSLLDEVIKFIKSYLELPKGKESNYLILGLWIFHTYIIEKIEATPLIYFYGVYETGKSRAGEVLKELGFRCETITSPTEAVLFRGADYFKGALIVDQVKIWGSEGNKDIATLIKARYKRGLMVPRINLNKSGEDQIEYFDTFGPMVICTDETMPQDIESRCITFQMQKNANPKVEGEIDKELAKSIRNKLIVFRGNYVDQELEKVKPVSRRRLNEILYPLYQILMEIAPERKDEFKLIIKEIEQKKEGEEGLSFEADIVSEIVKYYNETGEESFLTSELVNRLNEDKRDKDQLSDRLISLRTKRLGFEKIRLGGNKRGFRIDLNLLEKIIPQFKAVKIEKKEQSLNLT